MNGADDLLDADYRINTIGLWLVARVIAGISGKALWCRLAPIVKADEASK